MNLIKNPMSLFYKSINLNDATSYLNEMKSKFKELTNRTTREILIEDEMILN